MTTNESEIRNLVDNYQLNSFRFALKQKNWNQVTLLLPKIELNDNTLSAITNQEQTEKIKNTIRIFIRFNLRIHSIKFKLLLD